MANEEIENRERLSDSAKKAKRNLLFFSVFAMALFFGWVRPEDGEATVRLVGIGVETTITVILIGLAALLVYNLVSFWVHAPFGDGRTAERKIFILDPIKGRETGASSLFSHIRSKAGHNALPENINEKIQLNDWLDRKVENGKWNSGYNNKNLALLSLWDALSCVAKFRLTISATSIPYVRRLIIEDYLDVIIPFIAGIFGLVFVILALYRFSNLFE